MHLRLLKYGQVARTHLPLEIRPAVLVAHLLDFVEAAELQRLVLIYRWPNVLAVVAVFHFLQQNCYNLWTDGNIS